jgi:hypothetical protein
MKKFGRKRPKRIRELRNSGIEEFLNTECGN